MRDMTERKTDLFSKGGYTEINEEFYSAVNKTASLVMDRAEAISSMPVEGAEVVQELAIGLERAMELIEDLHVRLNQTEAIQRKTAPVSETRH